MYKINNSYYGSLEATVKECFKGTHTIITRLQDGKEWEFTQTPAPGGRDGFLVNGERILAYEVRRILNA